MPLAHYRIPITDGSGNVQTGTVVTVVDSRTGANAALKSNREGTSALDNPLTVTDGILDFYVVGGAYHISGVNGAFSFSWPYIGIGTLQEYDVDAVLIGKRLQVRAVSQTNITISTALNNGDSLDGLTLATNDLVLVAGQTTRSQNGIYVVGVSPARSAEFDSFDEHVGSLITVTSGTSGANTAWLCSANAGGVLDTDPIDFTKVNVVSGPQGPAGAAGASATIAVGTVITGNTGTPASVSNSGTSSAAVFDFTLPKGATGDAGVATAFPNQNAAAGTYTINKVNGTVQTITALGNFTVAFSGWPSSGTYGEIVVRAIDWGAYTITWPAALSGNWTTSGGTPPTLNASGSSWIAFWTIDGGTTIFGHLAVSA